MLIALSSHQQLFILLFRHLMACLKLLAFFCLALIFIVHHQLIYWVIRNKQRRLNTILKSINRYCHLTLKLLSIQVEKHGELGDARSRLMVANHLSYIDALVVYSLNPCLFVTSVEIQHTFLLGQLTSLSGCFFVERRKVLRSEQRMKFEINELKFHLAQGHNIFLFPEGTSSAGETVLPFKAHFFQVAMDSGRGVLPMVLSYQGENRDVVPWYGKMTFADHLYRICLQEKIEAKVDILAEVSAKDFVDKFQYTNHVHQKVKAHYEKH